MKDYGPTLMHISSFKSNLPDYVQFEMNVSLCTTEMEDVAALCNRHVILLSISSVIKIPRDGFRGL